MGRKSIKADKNLWQVAREEAGLTRERASEGMPGISDDRIEKVESGRSPIRPDEVLAMSRCYERPELCNLYCALECPIGKDSVRQVPRQDLAAISLHILQGLHELEQDRDRLIAISADGQVTPDELDDFRAIEEKLNQISDTVTALQLWIRRQKDLRRQLED